MRRFALSLVLPLIAAAAAAQPEVTVPVAPVPPVIDGRLDPEEWRGAVVLEGFGQVEPGEGVPGSEPTRILLMIDADHLYLGLDMEDSDPAGIRASQIVRDAVLDPDDRVEIILDTFHDRRNAYFFQIGPGGSKGDALIGNNGSFFEKSWDGIWEGRSRVHEGGWSAEMAIPAKTLSLQPGLDHWGFNATRHVKRKNEVLQWASPSRQTRLFQVAGAGTLHGMSVLDQGVGLDVVPFVSLGGRRDHPGGADATEAEPGLDLRYRVTPSLTASLTVNTDFAETEVDNRVVNLTRFPVFFPEKRDFFLEDSAIFSLPTGDDLVPFFSRRIGLSAEGLPVPILGGAKLAGRVGPWSLGLLDVATDDLSGLDGRSLEGQNLGVVRVARNVLAESQVGALVTFGDPAGGGDNTLAGLDFVYRTRELFGRYTLSASAFALGTRDEPAAGAREDGHAYGFLLDLPNDFWGTGIGFREISDDFRPDLGFVSRRGVRNLFGGFGLNPRPADDGRFAPVRRFTFGLDVDVVWDAASGLVETAAYRATVFEILLDSGDSFEVEVTPTEERLFEPFEIRPGIVLPPGRYTFERAAAGLELADKRPLAGSVGWQTGTFFGGRRDVYTAALAVRAVRGLATELEWEHNDVRLPQGDFTTHLARLRLQVDFTPETSWSTFVQWDDTSDTVGVNSRLRFILSPGRDLFFVVNRGFATRAPVIGPGGRRVRTFAPLDTDVTLKAEYTLRF